MLSPPSHIGIYSEQLCEVATQLCAQGKGILATDESTATMGKRFAAVGIENTEENRRRYRQMIYSTKGLDDHISGVILYEETLEQRNNFGVSFPDVLRSRNILVGIKVDRGAKDLYGSHMEVISQGLDDLDVRCQKYYQLGARFAKWRAIFHIRDPIGATPSELAIRTNAMALARYASICQANGLTPVIEPEVLMDGDFSIQVAFNATQRVLSAVYAELTAHHVLLAGTVLKPNMVRTGSGARQPPAGPEEIARMTLAVLENTVPSAVPGVFFLSGGMLEEEATLALDAINRLAAQDDGSKVPWRLTFSFGRALQQTSLKVWADGRQTVDEMGSAQAVLKARCTANGLASGGRYSQQALLTDEMTTLGDPWKV